jgi:predicted XRE-type DNA-binding protein
MCFRIEARHRDATKGNRADPHPAKVGGAPVFWQSPGGMTVGMTHEESSGNVSADLGFPNSEQELVKAKLTVQIYQILKQRKLNQTDAARLLGTTQAQVSALMRCRPVSVSVGKLMEFLTNLGQDVEVTIKPGASHGTGHMSVTVHQPREPAPKV